MFKRASGFTFPEREKETAHQRHAPQTRKEFNDARRTSFSKMAWIRSESPPPFVTRQSMISDIRLNAMSLALGDNVEGDTVAMEDRRRCDGMSSGESMPRYPHKSASARVSARLADEGDNADESDMLGAINGWRQIDDRQSRAQKCGVGV